MENLFTLRPVTREEFPQVRRLAETIWPICYREILSPEQISYMMEMMYSFPVIGKEVSEGVRYAFAEQANTLAGYLAWGPCEELPGTAKLHKLYLLPEYQGKGVGSSALSAVKAEAKAAGFTRLRLNVNRRNAKAIACYTRNGFTTVSEENNDIGGGFFMTDYVMETEL